MEIQDIDEIELSMPPRSQKRQHVQTTSRAKCNLMVSLFVLLNYCLIFNVDGQLMRLDRLQSRMVQKRSDRASPALRGLLDTLLEPTRTASSSNGWKGFVFMDPLFKVQRSPSSSARVIQSPPVPSSPSFSMDSPQYETESAPIPYIIEPPVDMYQPMASNTRYSTAKRPYDDYYDDDDNGEPIPRVRSRKVKPVTTTTKKPNPTPAISIGPAFGGGTSIRLGKAKITFKKGSISLGPVEDHESESKKLSNNDKSTKRPYHNYGDETEANDYTGTSSRNQGSDRHQTNRDSKEHLDSRSVYSEDDYGPKYAANYKTSATGYYQSYKPYHNLDTLMDKQVNPNQGHRASLNEHSNSYSPQPVYKGSSKSAVTETYLTKGDYDYEDSVVTQLSSRKKTRDKRRDETVIEEDEENNEDKEPTVTKLNEKREKRKKNGNSKSNKKDFESDEDESKLTTENDEEPEDIDSTTEKASSTSTARPLRKKSQNKPKSQPNNSTPNLKVTSSRTSRNKAKTPKTTVKPDDNVSMDEKRLIKEHRATETDSVNHDDSDDEEENGENVETKKADSEDEEEEEKPSRLTTLTTPVTVTTKSGESKRRKSNSRQNGRRKNSNNRSSISTLKPTTIQSDDRQSSKSNVDMVYIGNRGQTVKTADQSKSKKGSIESVSILPGVGTPSDRGTVVTLKMSDDPSLGVIGSSSNSRKPGTIYQIRLTSKIPTEPAIVTKIAEDNGSIDIGKDENSLNRLIKMMQETLEDIRKSQTSSLLPSTISSSPCPPSKVNSQVIIEPIPTTQKPSLILSNLKASTVKPLVDPFLNLHHGNITVVPASMGNVSDIVDMLVKTSKLMQPSIGEKSVFSSSIADKTPMIKEFTSEANGNSEDKKSGTSDNFSIDLDSNNQSINSSDRPQAEESRTKGMTQNFNQQANIDENSDQNESKRQISSINNDNSDDVPIIVVLLPPEDDIGKGTIN